MKISKSLLPAAALVALFAGCQDEDFGFTTKDVKSSKYAEEFVKAFGDVDPNQDWSMAAETRALVNLPNIKGTAKMNIMTGDPKNPSTRLLGQIWLQDGQADFAFDAIEGKNSVFVTVEHEGKYKLYGQYSIVNGALCIGNVEIPVAGTRAGTRGISDVCPDNVTKNGSPVSVDCINIPTDEVIGYTFVASEGWQPVSHTFAEWKEIARNALPNNNPSIYTNESLFIYKKDVVDFSNAELKEAVPVLDENGNQIEYNGVKQWSSGAVDNGDGTISYYYNQNTYFTKTVDEWKAVYTVDANTHQLNSNVDGPWTNESVSVVPTVCPSTDAGAYYFGLQEDDTLWERKTTGITDYFGTAHPQLQYISNVEKGQYSWNIGWGASLFGNGALFAESVKYWDESKTKLYDESSIETMEKGLEIITTANQQPIDLPYIFGCTDYFNQFGYVYYTEGQDPLLQPHYVLIDDARPSKNMTYDGSATGNKDLGTYVQNAQNASQYTDTEQGQQAYLDLANKEVVGTTYRLMYFDEATQKFTYQFPAGVHIIFFIDDLGSESNQQNHTGYNEARYNYSLPELNERIGHTSPANGLKRPGGPNGLVKCIPFTSGGIHYVGFGDNSGDEDLNDIVFVVMGIDPENSLETCPIIWHINENHDSSPAVETDIFSRETVVVGKTYNSPGSDPSNGSKVFKGWSSTPDNRSNDLFTTLEDAPTESTDAIHYYAIWEFEEEPGDDPEWQSWIFACEDLGGTFDYDFNDLVFAVKKTTIAGSTNVKLELIPLAAGGTLNAELYYGENKLGEIHKLLGSDDFTSANLGGSEGTAVTLAESVEASISVSTISSNIKIKVTQKENDVKDGSYTITHTANDKDGSKTPEIIILPEGWDWPNEGVLITDVYPGFSGWANGGNTDWINSKKDGTVAGEHYIVNPLKGGDGPTPSLEVNVLPEEKTLSNGEISFQLANTDKIKDSFNTIEITFGYSGTENGTIKIGHSWGGWYAGEATQTISSSKLTASWTLSSEDVAGLQNATKWFRISASGLDGSATITKIVIK